MAGVPSCIIRFICHIPTGILGSRGLGYQNDALKLDDDLFNSIPNGLQFREGLQILGRAGLATFIWNFVLFVPSVLCSETQLGLIGVVDLLLTLVLIVGVSKQSMYLPRGYEQCANIEQWRLGEDGRNYFVELTTLDKYASSKPSDLCNELVQNWAIGIAVSILYLACGIINITIGLAGSSSTGFGDCFSLSTPTFDYPLRTTTNGWHLPLSEWNYRGLAPLRYLLPVLIPLDYAMASTSFLIRLTSKLVLRMQLQTKVKRKNIAWMRRNNKTDSPALPLEVVEIIAHNLHYADLTASTTFASAPATERAYRTVPFVIANVVSHAGPRRWFEKRSGLNIDPAAKPIAIDVSSWTFADGMALKLWHWANINPIVLWQSRLAIPNWSRRI
ncbi:hypothetical protein V2G26_012133 [Clonostachys chloroleuca]